MDAARGSFTIGTQDTTRSLETLQAQILARVRETAPSGELPEVARNEVLGFFHSVVRDIDHLRAPRYPQPLDRYFPWNAEERELNTALHVKESDNGTARGIKGEYRQVLNEIKKDRNLAETMVRKMGVGTHRLSNGDTVRISRDREGNVLVRTQRPDGSTKEVSYNERVPGDARIESSSKDGRTTVTERTGQAVSRSDGKVETRYSLDAKGRPLREERGPAHDDYTSTTVNPDGSTDTRELIYYPDDPGEEAVYEETHEPPRRGRIYQDEGAGRAIEQLRQENPKHITDDRLVQLVLTATADTDNQSAGREYQDLRKFVQENWSKLTPDAKAKWQIYERFVQDAKSKGQTGMPIQDYMKMMLQLFA